MKQQQVPKFAHLDYRILHELEISITEYFLLDMIYHLSGDGSRWSNKKIENIAADMRLSVSGIRQMRQRLIEKKLLIKGVGNRLRTSEKVHKVYFLDESELQKVHKVTPKSALSAQKSAQIVKKTPVENNYRITREREINNSKAQNPIASGPGYASARQVIENIKRRRFDRVGVNRNA